VPRLDKTGTYGKGAMTGRRMGRCVSGVQYENTQQEPRDTEMNQGAISKRNFSIGRRCRNGKSMGNGFKHGWSFS
jgi:hypothetical protein